MQKSGKGHGFSYTQDPTSEHALSDLRPICFKTSPAREVPLRNDPENPLRLELRFANFGLGIISLASVRQCDGGSSMTSRAK